MQDICSKEYTFREETELLHDEGHQMTNLSVS